MRRCRKIRSRLSIGFLLVLVINTSVSSAPAPSTLPGISFLSESDIREAAIAFANMSTSPGLEGATLTVDNEDRHSEQIRGSLGFTAEFTIKKHIFNGYWGFAIVGGSLDDKLQLVADSGQRVRLDVSRELLGLRGSLGLSFPINQRFKLRPYVSLVVSDLTTESTFDEQVITDPTGNTTTVSMFKSSAQLASLIGSIDALYSRWYGEKRLELSAQYNLIYTDAFSVDNPVLNTTAVSHTVQLKSRYSGPTSLITSGKPWRWLAYANYTNFLSHNTVSLGYTSLIDFGGGMEWQLNIKPLDWFGWQALGIKAGLIVGDDVEGYKFGLTAR